VVCNPEPEALADCLARLLLLPDPCWRQRAQALAREQFAWPAIADRFAGAYQELVR
jgi:glycosyltransferase involved in cell wall biosynthesis